MRFSNPIRDRASGGEWINSPKLKTTVLLGLTLTLSALVADWPRFRGLTGDGATTETNLPLNWSDTENLLWRAELPGPGSSSYIISGEREFLTCYSGYGVDAKDPGDMGNLNLHIYYVSRTSGTVVLAAKPQFEPLTTDRIVGDSGIFNRSPAVASDQIFCNQMNLATASAANDARDSLPFIQ